MYLQEDIHDKLEDISWERATFLDTQALVCRTEDQVHDVNDDLQRELCFYNQVPSTPSVERVAPKL